MKPIYLLPCFLLGFWVGTLHTKATWKPPEHNIIIRWFQGDNEHKMGQDVPGVWGPMTKPMKDMVERTEKAARKVKK